MKPSGVHRTHPLGRLVSQLLLIGVALIIVFPFAWMIDTAVKPNGSVFKLPPRFVEGKIELGNFVNAWTALPFGRFVFNDLLVSCLGTILVLITSSLSAYAFSRLQFKWRDHIFLLYLSTLMVPQAVLVVPLFLIMKYFGWINSYQALILPAAFSAFGTFMMRQFFKTIPVEMDEAALIDGCSRWGVLTKIIIPLSKPAMGVLGLFTFIGYWNNFLWPIIVTNSANMATLPLGLSMYQGQHATEWNYMMAGSTISILPGVILVILLQRYLVEGINLSGLGGR